MSPLIYLSCAWIAGIFIGTIFDLPYVLVLTGLVPLPFLFFLRYRNIILLASLTLATFFVASAYSFSSQHTVNENSLHFYNNSGVREIKGTVSRDPEVSDRSTHLYFSASEIKVGESWQAIEGKALLFVPRYADYQYGDVLSVSGRLETPTQLGDFDYAGYLKHQGIHTTMLYPKIEIVNRGRGFKPLEWLYSLRKSLAETMAKVLPEPQASLAQGLILGIRTNIPQNVKADFIHSGTAHLLAISGLNLSIIAGIMLGVGIWLFGRRHYIYVWLALATIWLYALLTGWHPPAVRGAIMASLFLGAELFGRQKSAIVPLTFAAAIMAGISPYVLGDAAFQLSFLAMAGLVFLYPTLYATGRKLVSRTLGEEGALVSFANLTTDSFSATLAATVFVLPLIAYYFGIVSLLGPLATLLALPALPATIILGTLAGVVGFFFLPAAQVIGWLSWLFLTYILLVARAFSLPPFAFLEVGKIDPTLIWFYYAILVLALWSGNQRKTIAMKFKALAAPLAQLPRKWITPPLFVVAALVAVTAVAMPDNTVHVSFLNVGQGDAILIEKGSQQILIDGGPSPQAINLELGKKMPFWDRAIDLVFLTHPHHDHLSGLVEVLQRYQVSQVIYPDLAYDSSVYDEWRKLITAKRIIPIFAQAGQQVRLGDDLTIKVLRPQAVFATGDESDLDNNSLVLRLTAGAITFLFTADIRQEAEALFIQQRADLSSDIYKIAHHGSKTSNSARFLAVVNPEVAVISVGENRFGHPSEEVLERLELKLAKENVYRTDEDGTIEFITDGERLWMKTER